ncbi:MAG: hypothetical protein ACI89J_002016 [Hyphomicrobiaceae bacterium]|jgi:uncharacterized protein (TIGR02186 family)
MALLLRATGTRMKPTVLTMAARLLMIGSVAAGLGIAQGAVTDTAMAQSSVSGGANVVQPPAATPKRLREIVHADISTRSVQVTSSFTGTEIIVFGSIEHGRPEHAASEDLYDVVVVLEGTPEKLVARRKSNVVGLWINTQSMTFESVPSYYAISSTRPLDEIASPLVLRNHDIGFDKVRMLPVGGWESGITTADLRKFKEAVIRLKNSSGLYVQSDYGVVFVGGASLFRTTIDLPANVPVGNLNARVMLFRKGQMLSQFKSQVRMQRQGIERYLHDFAFGYPLLYGITAVIVAAGAGLAASSYFNRRRA